MRRYARGALAIAAVAVALLIACSTRQAGLELILVTDLKAPDDYDTLDVVIGQEGTSLRHDFRPTKPVPLPGTFAIAAGSLPNQEAIIDARLLKAGATVVSRQAQVQVPKDRVAELTLVLGRKCVGVTCGAGLTCDPQTDAGAAACVSVVVDPVTLPTFAPPDVDAAAATVAVSGGSSSGSSSSGSGSGTGSGGGSSGSASSGGSGSSSGGSGLDASTDAPGDDSTVAVDATIDGNAVGSGPATQPDSSTDMPVDAPAEASGDTEGQDAPVEVAADTGPPDAPPGSGDSTLVAYYPLTGTATSADASGNGRTATMHGATFSAGIQGNAATMNGTTQYVALPAGIVDGLMSFTISAWFYLNDGTLNSRVFDFGSGPTTYMTVTPAQIRFAISTSGNSGEQQVIGPVEPTGVWQHVAVTLSGNTGTLYINGVALKPNTSMTLRPASLGTTTQDWLGRSQYAADPYLNGKIDNFRIYNRALNATEVQQLFQQQL